MKFMAMPIIIGTIRTKPKTLESQMDELKISRIQTVQTCADIFDDAEKAACNLKSFSLSCKNHQISGVNIHHPIIIIIIIKMKVEPISILKSLRWRDGKEKKIYREREIRIKTIHMATFLKSVKILRRVLILKLDFFF